MRRAFFDTFWHYTFRNVPLIVGGDLTVYLVYKGQRRHRTPFFHIFQFIDIYRAKFPTTPLYTWVNGPRTIDCRLDRFYVPLSWKNLVSNVTAKPFVYSDHSLIRTVGHSKTRGPGTVEPRYNEVPCITNDIVQPGRSYSKMYGT